jgi:hypothetical protein
MGDFFANLPTITIVSLGRHIRETILFAARLCRRCCYERSFPDPLTHPLPRRSETILLASLALAQYRGVGPPPDLCHPVDGFAVDGDMVARGR